MFSFGTNEARGEQCNDFIFAFLLSVSFYVFVCLHFVSSGIRTVLKLDTLNVLVLCFNVYMEESIFASDTPKI